jgi:predicted nucleotidyltransferase
MLKRSFTLGDDDAIVLPRGTRAVLKSAAVDDDGRSHRAGVHVVVHEARGRVYRVHTVAGAWLTATRDQLRPEREDLLETLGRRQVDFARLREGVVLSTTVGSQAWGLATEDSDEDVRGCFVLPHDDFASIFDAPDEIHDDSAPPEGPHEAFWEIEKFVKQALRADPNTLETLWSPLVRHCSGIGARLLDERAIFSSQHVLGSFGRYATSQLKKLEAAQLRRRQLEALLVAIDTGDVADDARAARIVTDVVDLAGADAAGIATDGGRDVVVGVVRSVFDRGLITASSLDALKAGVHALGVARLLPDEVRPKNAYNLLRLLHSAVHWLRRGEPLIVVPSPLKETLLAIKSGETSLDDTLALAWQQAAVVDAVAQEEASLPPSPNFAAADAIVIEARRQAARVALSMAPSAFLSSSSSRADNALAQHIAEDPLPDDVDVPALRRFIEAQSRLIPGPLLWMGLTGAHAYGFPSPDSDLDLKAVHVVAADRLLTSQNAPPPHEVVVDDWEGRELDLSSHELGQCAQLLLRGNGNMLERLLGPFVVVRTPMGQRLAEWARLNLTSRAVHHYRGFVRAMVREHDIDIRDRGGPRAKRLLYIYRAALTGVHLLKAEELVTDVRVLAPLYGFADNVTTLLGHKVRAELESVPAEVVDAALEGDLPRLRQLLDDAERHTSLPEAPKDQAGLDALLVEGRFAAHRRRSSA